MQPKTGLASKISQLISQTNEFQNTYQPILFRLTDETQKKAFELLINNTANLQIFDHIRAQVAELIKCLQPTIVFLPPAELEKAVEDQFQGKESSEYGVWVYYPWLAKLVHILDENEFIIVRTNRNKHKITLAEQQKLADKKIGVMGLSVGQSVSLTLAMERGFGELRIADFDELDLSNINRIRTGVQNLKIKKTVIVAREIAEIDPYLKVVCFNEGITDENLDNFLQGNGKLDLLIDECDSFDIKINSRLKAKALGIPVLMEGSDRGTIDIERFDIEPNRAVLHGMVAHLDMEKFSSLTSMDEKIPYMTAVTGVETLSPRMKASAIEIMSTISTWPQLASAVTFGGGITADLARKILLGNLNVSGRFFIDMDELISDSDQSQKTDTHQNDLAAPLQLNEIEDFISKNSFELPETKEVLSSEIITALIEAAAQAPSGGNNQPWRFHYQNGVLHLFLEQSVAKAYLDPDYISSMTSLGAAIENLLLKAASLNLVVNWTLTPQFVPQHIACFCFNQGHQASEKEKSLAAQINLRHTNRKIVPKQELAQAELDQLQSSTQHIDGLKLKWLTDPAKIQALAGICTHTDILRLFIPEAHQDFITREMRWNLKDVNLTEDGIGIHTLDLSNNDQIGLRLIRDRRAINVLQQIKGGSGFKRLTMQQLMSASVIGLITMPKSAATAFIEGGRAAESLWLTANHLNIQLHPLNVPLIFFYKNTVAKQVFIPEDEKAILSQLEHNFNLLFENSEEEQAIFMFRLFKASPSPERTIRKSTSKIFSVGRA